MIYVNIQGGLGNQLFQSCFGLLVEQLSGVPARFLNHSFTNYSYGFKYELDLFPHLQNRAISPDVIPPEAIILRENQNELAPANALGQIAQFAREHKDIVLDGYWSNEAYWAGNEEFVRTLATPVPPNSELGQLGTQIRNMNAIGIHVRRHEYGHHGVARMDYYRNALKEIRRIHGDLPALVFTDEFNVCQFEFQGIPNIEVVRGDPKDPFLDFYALCSCRHFILSNSSYSYWGAFIGETPDSIVYMPYPFCTHSSATVLHQRAQRWHIVEGAVRKA
ncbi:alpha-1,2-fucosyltransferase [Zoogloea sp. LCSB751]|uniref:alpha-1,2-fucosyltransferase n=1 Tax=Zoogloea sp. LCSB751 TaxID=1965277 RepID=UPI0009A4DF1F|nr:alpha-1,2-fucosyltransferase [Zoogloea sp. LCSB751]